MQNGLSTPKTIDSITITKPCWFSSPAHLWLPEPGVSFWLDLMLMSRTITREEDNLFNLFNSLLFAVACAL